MDEDISVFSKIFTKERYCVLLLETAVVIFSRWNLAWKQTLLDKLD